VFICVDIVLCMSDESVAGLLWWESWSSEEGGGYK